MSRVADPVIARLIEEGEEDSRLSALLGFDLSGPTSARSSTIHLPLAEWLRRSEEVHRFLSAARRAERVRPTP
jgi:hypothetical protein